MDWLWSIFPGALGGHEYAKRLTFTLLLHCTQHSRSPASLILGPKSLQHQDPTDHGTIVVTLQRIFPQDAGYRNHTKHHTIILHNDRRRSPRPSAVSSREAQER